MEILKMKNNEGKEVLVVSWNREVLGNHTDAEWDALTCLNLPVLMLDKRGFRVSNGPRLVVSGSLEDNVPDRAYQGITGSPGPTVPGEVSHVGTFPPKRGSGSS